MRRIIFGLIVFATALSLCRIVQAHSQSQLFFDASGSDQAAFGPNEIITISGNITFHGKSDSTGVPGAHPDVFYPIADFYVLPNGYLHTTTASVPLKDVSGVPNTIFGIGGGGFIEQTIATTKPVGSLPSGEYDVVIDEHQDGFFTPAHDFHDGIGDTFAFSVLIPAHVPLIPGDAIADMKLKAEAQYEMAVRELLIFAVIKKVTDDIDLAFPNGSVDVFFHELGKSADALGEHFGADPKEGTTVALLNQEKKYDALVADPPDPNFAQLVTLAPITPFFSPDTNALNQASARLANSFQQENVLADALLASLEKYQGAYEQSHGYWALAHAREIQMYATLLADQLTRSEAALANFRSAVANDPRDFDGAAANARTVQARVRDQGFSLDEQKELRGLGMDDAAIAGFRNLILTDSLNLSRADALTNLDGLALAETNGIVAYHNLAASMNTVISNLLADDTLDRSQPIANAGGPYSGTAGAPVAFDASASTDPQSFPLTYAWDLDGNGQFNDAADTNVSRVFTNGYSGYIGVVVTNTAGKSSVAYAFLQVADTNHPPVFQSLSPAAGNALATVGNTLNFQASATDPDGDSVTIEWLLDGIVVATGTAFNYQPVNADAGLHDVTVRASDGHGNTGTATHFWLTTVVQPVSLVDVAVSQTHQPNPAQVGKDIVYAITVTNAGPDAATGLVLTNVLSPFATFVTATASQGSTAQMGDDLVANLGTLTNGGFATVNIILNAATAGTFSNSVRVAATESDVNALNNRSDEKTRINDPAALIADLSVNQTAAPNPVTVSNTLTYTIVVKNAGPNDATGVVLTESLAPGLIYLGSSQAVSSQDGNTLAFDLGTVPNSSIVSVPVTLQVQATNSGIFMSVASVLGNESEPDFGNNEVSVTTTVNPPSPNVADLAITLTASTNAVPAGAALTYTLTVTNQGPDTATGVTVSDTLPADVTPLSALATQGTATMLGGLVSASLGTLTNGGTAQVTLVVGTLFAGPIVNSASVSASEQDLNSGDNTASVSGTVANSTNGTIAIVQNFPDVEITKLQSYLAEMGLVSQVFNQEGLTFDALKNFKLIIWDDLSYAAGGLTANDVDNFQAAFNAHIPLYFIGDDLALSATYALGGTPEETNWVNLIHLNATADNYGGNRSFTIIDHTHPVVNGPFGLVGDSTYGYDPDNTTRTGTGEIPLGVSGPNDVLVAFKDPVSKTKSVTQNILPVTQTDAAGIAEKKKLFKNAVTWLLAADPVADLTLYSIAVPNTVAVGNLLTFHLTVKNNGPDHASHVIVSETLPAEVTFVSAAPAPASQDDNKLTFDLGDVANANGAAASLSITVKPAVPGTFVNSATISANSDDPNTADNRADVPFTVLPASPFTADLAASQTISSNVISVGDPFTYTVTVTNQGPDAANDVHVIDGLPNGATFVSTSASQGSANQVENGVVANFGSLAAGASAQVTITMQAGQPGVIANFATVSGDAADLNGANNSTTLQSLVLVRSGGADEVVSYQSLGWRYKILQPSDSLPAGFWQSDFDDSSWATGAAAFGNRGGCPLQATVQTTWPTSTRLLVRRELRLPCAISGLHIFVAVDNDVEAVFFNGVLLQTVNTHDGCPSQDDFRFDVPTALIRPGRNIVAYQVLDRGGESFFDSRILTDAPPAPDDAVADFSSAQNPNGVWSYGYSTTRGTPFNLDTLAGTNSPQGFETWSGTASGPHIVHNFSGVTQTYATITQPPNLLNLDPSFDGRNAVVRWTAPAAGTYEVQGRFQGLDSTTTDAAVLLNSTNTLFSANINGFGQTAAFDLPVTVAAGDQIDFSVGQGTGGSFSDSTGLGATITRLESSATPVLSADLAITVAGPTNVITVGNVFNYTLTVTNPGPDTASGAILTATLPNGIALISAATTQGAISQNGNPLMVLLNTLSKGASATVTVTATATAVGTLVGTASVTGNECDPNLADNQLIQRINVNSPTADLAISASPVPPQVALGGLINYSFVITNNGPQNADGVTFNDTLPAGVAFVSAVAGRGVITHSATTVSGSLGALTNGGSVTISIVAQPTATGTFTNRATVSSFVADSDASNNVIGQSTLVPTAAAMSDLSVSIRASGPVNAGQQERYIITVANAGPIAATGIALTDHLPLGVTLVSTSVPLVPPAIGGVLNFALGTLDVGASTNVEIFVLTTVPGIATNSASVAGIEADPSAGNNSAALNVVINPAPAPSPDLSLAITANANPVILGAPLSFTITVTNRSATMATGVVLSNTLPVDADFVSANSSSGSAVQNGGAVVASIGTMPGGSFAVLNVTTMPTNAGVLVTKATASSVEPDANPGDNTVFGAAAVTNTGVADLALSISASPDPVAVGSNLTYTILVTNRGPSIATGVFTTNQLAPGVTFVSATGGVSPSDGLLIFNVGILAAGDADSVQFVVVPGAAGTLTNVAGVFANESDPVGTNNSVSALTSAGIAPPPPTVVDLSLDIAAAPNPVGVGAPLTYSLTVTNNSSAPATGVVVTNTLPPNVSVISVLPSQGSATNQAGVVTYTVGSLPNGTAATLAIVVVPNVAGLLTNKAITFSVQTDSQPTNNSVTNVTSAVTVPITNLVLTVLSSITLNPQTGLFELRVKVVNGGPTTPSSVLVLVSGLAPNAHLYNATGITNGTPFVQSTAPLGVGSNIIFLLEFYVPTRVAPANLTYTVEAGPPVIPPVVSGMILNISQKIVLSNGSVLIEFSAVPGQIYAIQYSSDMVTWRTAVPAITAPANRVQWIDAGPPKTDSSPAQQGARYYRVVLLSAK